MGWTDTAGATYHSVGWSPQDGNGPNPQNFTVQSTTITNLKSGVEYTVTVTAGNAGGESTPASQIIYTSKNYFVISSYNVIQKSLIKIEKCCV